MPLDMPESVLVRYSGTMQPGITLRDLVHAIPYYAKKEGLLTVEKQGKINVFSGRVLEIEGEGISKLKCEQVRLRACVIRLPCDPCSRPRPLAARWLFWVAPPADSSGWLTMRALACARGGQAFELSDASAERSAAGCTIKLDAEPIAEFLTSNIVMLKWMIAEVRAMPAPAHRRTSAHPSQRACVLHPAPLGCLPHAITAPPIGLPSPSSDPPRAVGGRATATGARSSAASPRWRTGSRSRR
jgi:aconitate hydratase 2/2-methylisocitrate dehydratase